MARVAGFYPGGERGCVPAELDKHAFSVKAALEKSTRRVQHRSLGLEEKWLHTVWIIASQVPFTPTPSWCGRKRERAEDRARYFEVSWRRDSLMAIWRRSPPFFRIAIRVAPQR